MPAPPRRSTSTAWCATTTCAQSPELGDLQINLAEKADAQAQQPCHRARPAAAAAGAGAAARQHAAGGGGAARAAGAGHAAGRDLRAGCRDAPRGGGAGEGAVPFGAVHRRCRRLVRPAAAAPARRRSTRTISSISASSRRDVYDTVQALFGGIGVGYSHRGEERDPIEIRIGLPKRDLSWNERLAATPVPANTLPGSKTVVELGEVVRVDEGAGLAGAVPPRRALRRDGHGRARRRVRGADLRHARGADRRRRARLGQPAEAGDQLPRPAGRRGEADAAVGRRVGDHLRHVPRHGRGVRRGDARASTSWWWRSSAASSCRW